MSTEMQSPVDDFSQCHVGIIQNFEALKVLGNSDISDPVQPEIQKSAKKLVQFYKEVVLNHHMEEEQELFNMVLDCAKPGAEQSEAKSMVDRLTKEHRNLEKQWKTIEADIKKLSKGKFSKLDKDASVSMAQNYLAHAHYEEQEFLPLSAVILKDTGLESLGFTLHTRHNVDKIPSYM
ncbi:hemerythrin domain-containing protein [Amphritea sp.]|uniref:hemerythrin domain-containing protein n=1 Tax=Amphritea sp. TaxID=1872502 RepID=UPI0025B875F7|nr:hemerythrin domain-containing protein [Amphritea sp.]